MIAAKTSPPVSGRCARPHLGSTVRSRNPEKQSCPNSLCANDLLIGENQFASQLIRRKAHQLVRHPGFNQSDRLDIEQEFKLELLQKLHAFDAKRARVTTFIARVIENKSASLIRSRIAEKRDYRRRASSLNTRVGDSEGGCVDRGQALESSAVSNHRGPASRTHEELAQLRMDLAAVCESLPNNLQQLADLLSKMSAHAAGKQLGQSRRRIAKGVTELRARFEDAHLRDYL